MGTHTFKRGMIRAPETWTLSGKTLSGPRGQIDLAWVEGAQFALHYVGRADFWGGELILVQTGKKKVVLSCADRLRGENFAHFLDLASEIALAYGQARPGALFAPTAGMAFLRWFFMLFAIGIIACGPYLLFIGLTSPQDRAPNPTRGVLIVFGVGAILVGALYLFLMAPWEKPQPKTPDDVRAWIERVRQL